MPSSPWKPYEPNNILPVHGVCFVLSSVVEISLIWLLYSSLPLSFLDHAIAALHDLTLKIYFAILLVLLYSQGEQWQPNHIVLITCRIWGQHCRRLRRWSPCHGKLPNKADKVLTHIIGLLSVLAWSSMYALNYSFVIAGSYPALDPFWVCINCTSLRVMVLF